jgi:hypothetical protein
VLPTRSALAAALTACCFVVADAAVRHNLPAGSVLKHWGASLALYAAAAGAVTVSAALLVGVARWLRSRLEPRHPVLARAAASLWWASASMAASTSVAFWAFSGAKARRTVLAMWGPYACILAVGLAVAGLTLVVDWAVRGKPKGNPLRSVVVAAGCAGGAVLAARVDLTVFVALYARLHAALEAATWVLLLVFWSLVARLVARAWSPPKWLSHGATLALLGWTVAYATVPRVRHPIEDSLRHVWLEDVYVGRMLRRTGDAVAYMSSLGAWKGPELQRLSQFTRKYDIASTARSPAWDDPAPESPKLVQAVQALRGQRRDLNIIVYYVDTLRHDVSADPALMPNTVAFARSAIDFTHAYSTGSDTLRALPGLTGGSYDFAATKPTDMLSVARQAGMAPTLVISQSAFEFLDKLRPTFRFEETLHIRDYDSAKKVWGYGADAPTAERLVDTALEWIDKNAGRRFLLWVFNFDVHAWRELNEDYIEAAAKRLGVPKEGKFPQRYRVVARDIDAEFGRLLEGLEARNLDRNTLVLAVSDHGEGLGRHDFWVHSVFLWEPLVRVMLAMRVPGLKPAVVDDKVSLVDVAPTLARYMVAEPDMSDYHGEDLLGYLLPRRPPRRFPLLMSACSKLVMARIGLVDPVGPWKLVLPFESAVPELYDLRAQDPDAASVAEAHPRRMLEMLNVLVSSPLYPRKEADLEAYIR